MNAIELLAAYGVAVRFADLGDWGSAELRSEYDAGILEIRINARVAAELSGEERERFVALAIGHELYHHREAIGEVPVARDRAARECAAETYARRLLEGAA